MVRTWHPYEEMGRARREDRRGIPRAKDALGMTSVFYLDWDTRRCGLDPSSQRMLLRTTSLFWCGAALQEWQETSELGSVTARMVVGRGRWRSGKWSASWARSWRTIRRTKLRHVECNRDCRRA
jgi:hypothetical protein